MKILELPVPAGLTEALQGLGLDEAKLDISDVALCLSARVSEPGRWTKAEESPRTIALAALSIRDAALRERLDLPVLVILGLPDGTEGGYAKFRPVFDRWAGDQDWHRGDFALYLCPPIDPEGEDWQEWRGPKTRKEMVERLLGEGAESWNVEPVFRPSVESVAEQLERWCTEHGIGRSSPHGDLVQSVAAALRRLDDTVSKDGSEATRQAAEAGAVEAIDAWAFRQVRAADSAPSAEDGP